MGDSPNNSPEPRLGQRSAKRAVLSPRRLTVGAGCVAVLLTVTALVSCFIPLQCPIGSYSFWVLEGRFGATFNPSAYLSRGTDPAYGVFVDRLFLSGFQLAQYREAWFIQVPFWLVMLGLGLLWGPLFAWAKRAQRRRTLALGLCRGCGYECRGLVLCPECGRASDAEIGINVQ